MRHGKCYGPIWGKPGKDNFRGAEATLESALVWSASRSLSSIVNTSAVTNMTHSMPHYISGFGVVTSQGGVAHH